MSRKVQIWLRIDQAEGTEKVLRSVADRFDSDVKRDINAILACKIAKSHIDEIIQIIDEAIARALST